MRALIIVHEPGGGSGLVGQRLIERDYELDEALVCPRMGETAGSFPADLDPRDHDLVVAMGSTHSLAEPDSIERWIHDELDFLRRADDAAVPVLGVCFGGQALAAAHGGAVRRLDRPQIGWYPQSAHPSGLPGGHWMEWHHDGFDPPTGAEVLVGDTWGPQVFTLRRNLAIQFHPEVTTADVRLWIDGVGHELPTGGVEADQLLADCALHEADAARRTAALVDWFLDDVARR